MRRALRGAWAVLVVTLAAALAGGCQEGSPPRPPERLAIAVTRTPNSALVHLALAKGCFAAEGLEVTAQPFDFGRLALEAVLEGKADLATVAETPLVLATLRGQRLAILGVAASTSRSNALLVRRGAGIGTVQGLAGKRIGVPRGTTSEFFLDTALVRGGLAVEAVTLVDLKPDLMSKALAAGAVDAVAVFVPHPSRLLRELGAEVTQLEQPPFHEHFALAALADFPARRPAAAERVMRALLRAEAIVREQPDEARRAAFEVMGMPKAEFDDLWGRFEYGVRLDQAFLSTLEAQARWAIRAGLAPPQPIPDFRQVMAPGPLRAASPDAVRIGP